MKLRLAAVLATLAFCVLPCQAVEMFTHFNDGQSLGWESRNAVKRQYPGYRLPDGRRVPLSTPRFYPAIPGSTPWGWKAP